MNERDEVPESALTAEENLDQPRFKPLRVWPLVILGVVFFAALFVRFLGLEAPAIQIITVLGPALCGILVIVWWLTFSRARWQERLFGLVGVVGAVVVTFLLLDKTMKGAPMIVVTIPMGMAAFGVGALLCRNVLSMKRTMVAVMLAAIGFRASTLLRGEGMWGNAAIGLDWRFRPSAEDRLVSAKANQTTQSGEQGGLSGFDPALLDEWLSKPQWPAFRGLHRTGTVIGTTLETNWSENPPQLLWKIPVGPGWSSFAVAGKLLFTQEQRGSMETVVCYHAESGEELWEQGIDSRFEESLGGPGPRATPTIGHGDLFVMGANGQLMRIDAKTGEVQWEIDLREVAKRKPPEWGFSSSPLVTDQLVIVHAGGNGELGTLAFDVSNGDLVWSVAAGDHSYSSPQICQLRGGEFVTMVTNAGVDFIDPSSGEIRLAYKWKQQGYRSLQPRVVGDDLVLIPSDASSGMRLVRINNADNTLTAEEVWESRGMKPDFNDLVTFEGYAYGFDGTIFACVDLETGERSWKRGRYGKGQVALIRDAGVLLVVSERGQVVLLNANPAAHEELGSIDGIDGKTWNHPVVVGDRLYIRNSTQAACFRLPVALPEGT